MIVRYESRTLFDTGCVSTDGNRTETLTYSGSATTISVQVVPNCAGGPPPTAWSFTVSCAN